jgi:hypothetical protein
VIEDSSLLLRDTTSLVDVLRHFKGIECLADVGKRSSGYAVSRHRRRESTFFIKIRNCLAVKFGILTVVLLSA